MNERSQVSGAANALELDPIDVALAAACPVVPVPRFGRLAVLETDGKRLLVAEDGVYLEVRRPWLHAAALLSRFPANTGIPYGRVETTVTFCGGAIPEAFLERFRLQAAAALPNETAAWITWREGKGYAYRELEVVSATPDRLSATRPELDLDEHLVLDLHSHGMDSAFFSHWDDGDDIGEVKIAGVFGLCHLDEPQREFRLCLGGVFLPLCLPEGN